MEEEEEEKEEEEGECFAVRQYLRVVDAASKGMGRCNYIKLREKVESIHT